MQLNQPGMTGPKSKAYLNKIIKDTEKKGFKSNVTKLLKKGQISQIESRIPNNDK